MSSSLSLLQARHLGRRVTERVLLDDVSIEIRNGDRLAIVGPTGSGKTLLLRALAMLDPLDTGCLLWHGREVCRNAVPRFRSRVIYLHQRPVLAEGTVEENLKQPFSLRVHRGRQFDRHVHCARLASMNRDESFLTKQHCDLSGGESQIVALLRAMQLDPEVLLLDEPTAALDAGTGEAVENIVNHWSRQHACRRATIWVTHDSGQAVRAADRVLRMSGGSLQRE